jgi:hypothetical protein
VLDIRSKKLICTPAIFFLADNSPGISSGEGPARFQGIQILNRRSGLRAIERNSDVRSAAEIENLVGSDRDAVIAAEEFARARPTRSLVTTRAG